MHIKVPKQYIPWAMAAGRAALGPVLIAGEACGWNGISLASLVVTALLSDIFDGVLARRWGCDTAGVRLFDSMADTVFYLSVAVALWIGQPQIWRGHAGLMSALLALEALRFAVDFAKFGKPASYHSYLAKSWGLVMAIAVVITLASRHVTPLVFMLISVALGLGTVCNLEGLAMSLVLPVWRKDVKGIWAALQLRRSLIGENRSQLVAALRRRIRAKRVAATIAGVVVLSVAAPVLAVEPGHAVYSGGTMGLAQEVGGILDTASPAALVFRFTNADGSAGQAEIDYKSMRTYEYRDEVTHHLGVLPAIAVGLLVRRQRQYFLTISYADASNASQVAIFEVSKHDVPALQAILRARVPRPCPGSVTACGRAVPVR